MPEGKNQNLRIGTSGLVIPVKKVDYPKEFQSGSRLSYYSSIFNTIEINSTFYKLPLPKTYIKWSLEVPEDFFFTLKLSKSITHIKNLKFEDGDIYNFFSNINIEEKKKGCILVQFPGSISSDYTEQVENILQQLYDLNKLSNWKIAVEFRNSSWYQEITYDMLNKFNYNLVYHDLSASKTPFVELNSDIIYLRFHGPLGNYRGEYSHQFLSGYAQLIKSWLIKGKKVYVYFNNTVGNAFQNALDLQQMVIHQI